MLRKFGIVFSILGIFGAAAAIIVFLNVMRPKPEDRETDLAAPSVFIEVATPTTTTVDVVTQGEVRPRTDINLTAQVGGRIVSTDRSFVNGGAFKKNDVLLRIEDTDYQLALTRAQARVAQAQQALNQEQAEADLARRDWEELGDGSPPSDLTLRLPQLRQAEANFQSARADEREARLNLDRTVIRAPFDGRVRTINVGLGQFITPGAQLGGIFSTDVAEIRLPLSDTDFATLRLPIAFTASDAAPGPDVILSSVVGAASHEWRGQIMRTEGAIDTATRQIGAIAVVNDPYGAGADQGVPLAMGLFVDATIKGRALDNVYVIPSTALYGRDAVYVVDDQNKLERRKVTTAAVTAKSVVVVAGLAPGEKVVISPLRGNGAGDAVTPIDSDDSQSRATPAPPTTAAAQR
ncbi:MAG: efflux RND transporter periplasmic adaptor subunit [Pseudomonadota bacterium]